MTDYDRMIDRKVFHLFTTEFYCYRCGNMRVKTVTGGWLKCCFETLEEIS